MAETTGLVWSDHQQRQQKDDQHGMSQVFQTPKRRPVLSDASNRRPMTKTKATASMTATPVEGLKRRCVTAVSSSIPVFDDSECQQMASTPATWTQQKYVADLADVSVVADEVSQVAIDESLLSSTVKKAKNRSQVHEQEQSQELDETFNPHLHDSMFDASKVADTPAGETTMLAQRIRATVNALGSDTPQQQEPYTPFTNMRRRFDNAMNVISDAVAPTPAAASGANPADADGSFHVVVPSRGGEQEEVATPVAHQKHQQQDQAADASTSMGDLDDSVATPVAQPQAGDAVSLRQRALASMPKPVIVIQDHTPSRAAGSEDSTVVDAKDCVSIATSPVSRFSTNDQATSCCATPAAQAQVASTSTMTSPFVVATSDLEAASPNTLRQQVETASISNELLRERCQVLEADIQALSNAKTTEVEKLASQIDELQAARHDASHKIQCLEQEIFEAQELATLRDTQVSELKEKLSSLSDAQSQNEDLKAKLAEIEDSRDDILQKMETLQLERDEALAIKETLAEAQEQAEQAVKDRLMALEQELVSLREEKASWDAERCGMEAKLATQATAMKNLQDDLRMVYSKNKKEMARLEQEYKHSAYKERYDAIVAENKMLRGRMDELHLAAVKLREAAVAQNQAQDMLTRDNSELTRRESEALSRESKLQSSLQLAQDNLGIVQKELELVRSKNTELQSRCDELVRQQDDLMEACDEDQGRLAQLEKANAGLKGELEGKQAAIGQLESSHSQLQAQVQSLEQQLSAAQAQLDQGHSASKEEVEALQERIQAQQQQLDELSQANAGKDEQLLSSQSSLASLKATVKERDARIKELSLQLEEKNKQYDELKDFMEEERTVRTDFIDDLEKEVAAATDRITELEKMLDEKDALVQELQSDSDARVEQLEKALSEEKELLQTEVTLARAQYQRLEGELVEKELMMETLQAEAEAYREYQKKQQASQESVDDFPSVQARVEEELRQHFM